MQVFVQSLVSGLLLGCLYAALGLSLSLMHGVMKVLNIAQGDFIVFAAYLIMTASTMMGLNVFVAFGITMVIMLILAYFMQRFLINRIIDKSEESSLLMTFGLSVIIQNALTLVFNVDSRAIKSPFSGVNFISTDYIVISATYMVNFIVAVVLVFGLNYVIKKTPFGRSIRASSSNIMVAELMGINTKRIYTQVMCICLGIACVAGFLLGQTFAFTPLSGSSYLIIAFGVMVIGGMGSIVGTLVGGIILGVSQLLGAYFFGTGFQMITAYIVLLIILTVRPQGLLSAKARA